MFGKILSLPLKPVTTCGKSPSQMSNRALNLPLQTLSIFSKALALYLVNMINKFHHMSSNSVLCTVKSTWPSIYLNNKNYNTSFLTICFYKSWIKEKKEWILTKSKFFDTFRKSICIVSIYWKKTFRKPKCNCN